MGTEIEKNSGGRGPDSERGSWPKFGLQATNNMTEEQRLRGLLWNGDPG